MKMAVPQPGYNWYWRRNYNSFSSKELRERLRQQGRQFAPSAEKWQLAEEVKRADRGDLAYGKQTVEDLQRYVRQRRLQPPKNFNSRRRLTEVLKDDDDHKVFPKFLDLPPELRERVYGFYLAGFPQVLEFPTQPPLARTCQLMRTEVLPAFYKKATFQLIFNTTLPRHALNLTAQTHSWLRLQPAELDGCMRKINLCITRPRAESRGEYHPIVELDSTGTRFTITHAKLRFPSYNIMQITPQMEKAYLDRAFTAICGSEGRNGIGMNEVYLIRKEAEAALR